MPAEIITVPFHDDNLEAVQDERGVWVSVRRVCEALGIDLSGQLQKLKAKSWACVEFVSIQMPNDSQRREIAMMHLDSLPMWLATIEESRVAPASRPSLARYQRECARVLRDHFFRPPVAAVASPPPEPLSAVAGFLTTCERILSLGGNLEPRDEILLRDFARSRLALTTPPGGTQFITAVDRAMELGYARLKRGEDTKLGKLVALYYRRRHGKDPPRHQQFVDGRAIQVNTYTRADLDVIDPAIRAFCAQVGLLPGACGCLGDDEDRPADPES